MLVYITYIIRLMIVITARRLYSSSAVENLWIPAFAGMTSVFSVPLSAFRHLQLLLLSRAPEAVGASSGLFQVIFFNKPDLGYGYDD